MLDYGEIIKDISKMQERLEGIGRTLSRMEKTATEDRCEFRQMIVKNREDIIKIKTKTKTGSFFLGVLGGVISFVIAIVLKFMDLFK